MLSGTIDDQVPLSEIPLREPTAGTTSNFVNPHSLAPAVVAVSVVMMVWAVSFVIIRLCANSQATRHLGIEDCEFESVHSSAFRQ